MDSARCWAELMLLECGWLVFLNVLLAMSELQDFGCWLCFCFAVFCAMAGVAIEPGPIPEIERSTAKCLLRRLLGEVLKDI